MSGKKFSHIVGIIALKENLSISDAIKKAQVICGISIADLLMMYAKR